MLTWCTNKNVGVFFDEIPSVGVRYSLPSMSKEERRAVEKFPFMCKKELKVLLTDYKKNKEYNFVIPKGYCYDGASIPRFFWRLIGPNTDNRFLIPALIHDILCENHNYIDNDRAFSTEVFNCLLEVSGIGFFKRFWMKNSVGVFQTIFCDW